MSADRLVNGPAGLEHTAHQWLPWRAAADRCYSPSNAEACLLLPRFAAEVCA